MAIIGTNSAGLNSSYYVNTNTESLLAAIKKLSSGSNLAEPSSDAAGVAVSGKLSAQVYQLDASVQNAQNVISFAQTTDGFLQTVQQQLTRMSELAQQATNGSFGNSDLANYNQEFVALRDQINQTLSNASFNGETIFQNNSSITTSISTEGDVASFSKVSFTSGTDLGVGSLTIGTTSSALNAINAISTALQSVTTARAGVNADVSAFSFYAQDLSTQSINTQVANSRIADVDVAQESVNLSQASIRQKASIAMHAQANSSKETVLALLK